MPPPHGGHLRPRSYARFSPIRARAAGFTPARTPRYSAAWPNRASGRSRPSCSRAPRTCASTSTRRSTRSSCVRPEVPEDAFTASILGTERIGNGVVIGDRRAGAHHRLPDHRGRPRSGSRRTRARRWPDTRSPTTRRRASGSSSRSAPSASPPLARGSAADASVGDTVILAGHGGRAHALKARVFAKREFAGYWEYVLDEAIFTQPAHPQWGGAALIGERRAAPRHRLAPGAGAGRRRTRSRAT